MNIFVVIISIIVIVACVSGAYHLGKKRGFIEGLKQGFADGIEAGGMLKNVIPKGVKCNVEIIKPDDEPELKERLLNLSNKENEKNDEE